MEFLSLSSECRVTVAVKSRPCLFCHFYSQCYIEKCHYSFVTLCWKPGVKMDNIKACISWWRQGCTAMLYGINSWIRSRVR